VTKIMDAMPIRSTGWDILIQAGSILQLEESDRIMVSKKHQYNVFRRAIEEGKV
jgi:hypothetical protein